MYGIFAVRITPLGGAGPLLGCGWKPGPSRSEDTFGGETASPAHWHWSQKGLKGYKGCLVILFYCRRRWLSPPLLMPALDSGASLPNAVEMVSFFLDGEFLLRKRRVTVVGSL